MEYRHIRPLLAAAALAALAIGSPASAQLPPPPPLPSVSVQIVHTAPPPPRPVVIVQQPAADVVWTDGYWDYRGSGWFWVEGRWVRPPAERVSWVRPEYVRVDGGWRYVPAHWSHQRVVVVEKEKGSNGKHKGWKKHKDKGHDRDDD